MGPERHYLTPVSGISPSFAALCISIAFGRRVTAQLCPVALSATRCLIPDKRREARAATERPLLGAREEEAEQNKQNDNPNNK